MRTEILIGGIGGQGVVYAANLLGKAATAEGKFASAAAHYGPESRGSVTTSEVVISDEPIDYPYTEQPDVFIALHQAAYEKEKHKIKPDGLIIVDSTLVNPAKSGADNIGGHPSGIPLRINYPVYTESFGVPQDKLSECVRNRVISRPATQLARDRLNNVTLANLILLGALVHETRIVSFEVLEKVLGEMTSRQGGTSLEALRLGLNKFGSSGKSVGKG